MLDFAFYKAEHGELDDKIIDWGSGKRGFSHCEFILSPTHTIAAHYLTNGVSDFYYNNIYADDRWEIVRVKGIPKKLAVETAQRYLGTKYDTLGVACSFIGISKCINYRKTWCSKLTAVIAGLQQVDLMPNDFYAIVTEEWGGEVLAKAVASSKHNKPELDRFGRVRVRSHTQ